MSDFSTTIEAGLDQPKAIIRTIWFEPFPNLDVSEGSVLSELVLGPAAYAFSYNDYIWNQYRASSTLYEIASDPDLVDDDILDKLLTNYGVIRDEGALATGSITMLLSSNDVTAVPVGMEFSTTGGVTFETLTSFTGVPTSDSITSTTDRLIVDRGSGSYSFSIDVTATEVGTSSNISKDTELTPTAAATNFVRSYAEGDFTGGGDEEDINDLIERVQYGVTSVGLGSRASIESLLGVAYSIVHTSITGVGDAEMLRDRHNIAAVSTGGKADIYIASATRPIETSSTKTATLIDATAGIWQISILRDDFPGYYAIASILPLGSSASGTQEVYLETRGLDLSVSGSEYVPFVSDITEGAYSRYQTAVIQFYDVTAAASAAVGDTASYTVSVYMMPNIATIQDYLNNDLIRDPCSDYLVRAAVPVFVGVSMVIETKAGSAAPVTATLATDIATAINARGFQADLPASVIVSACTANLPSGSEIQMPISFSGQLRYPDGTIDFDNEINELTVPSAPAACVSKKTVLFFCDPADVSISVSEVD